MRELLSTMRLMIWKLNSQKPKSMLEIATEF